MNTTTYELVETAGKTLASAQAVAKRAGYSKAHSMHWDGNLWVLRFLVPKANSQAKEAA